MNVYAGPAARSAARDLGLISSPARLRLSAGRAGFRLWLTEPGTGRELCTIGVYRTFWRVSLALRGILSRTGWRPQDGPPAVTVREVEFNLPLQAATWGDE